MGVIIVEGGQSVVAQEQALLGGYRVCGDWTEWLLAIIGGGGGVRAAITGFMRKKWEAIGNKVNILHLIFDYNSTTYVNFF